MRALIAAALLLTACRGEIRDGIYACTTNTDCPPDLSCSGGYCYRSPMDGGMDGAQEDGGGDAGVPACPTAPSGSIIGCATVTMILADGSRVVAARDMRRFTVAAYVRNGSAFDIVSGTASEDGIVRVDGVPDGASYYLRLHDPADPVAPYPHYFYTQQRDLRLHTIQRGRDDTTVSRPTPVTFDFTGLSPWKQDDILVAESINSGTSAGFDTSAIALDATTFNHTLDWQGTQGESTFFELLDSQRRGQIVDPARNDDFWVSHTRLSSVTNSASMVGYTGQTIVDHFTSNAVTIADGTSTTIPVGLQPSPTAPIGQRIAFNMTAARAAMRDGDRYLYEEWRCARYVNPGAADGLEGGNVLNVFGPTWSAETAIDVSLPYNNPFPTEWPHVMTCTFTHGHISQFGNFSYLWSYAPANNDFTWTFPVHTPTNVQIDGHDALAGGTIPFDGTAPVTVTWNTQAGVRHYAVRVLGVAEGGVVAKFDTFEETSLTLPADTFVAGGIYVFRVYAIQTPADYPGGDLLALEVPINVARLATEAFRFSSECGNGATDSGEDCDPGMATSSPTCDADCTMVRCGDGFTNTAAGEVCDEGDDGPRCDGFTCRRPMCGDGYPNRRAEECDDGNATDGDGCTVSCTLENCGDGTTGPFEECDDNNRVNGDGCSAMCRFDMAR